MGKHAPGTAAAKNVEDGVEDRPEVCGSRPAPRLGRRKQATDGMPFGVTEVTWVSHRRTLARLLDLSKHPLRNSEAVYVFKAHPLQEVGDVAEFLAHRLVPALFYEEYEWILVRKGKALSAFLTLEASSVKSGDTVLLLGNHRRPEWAPSAR